MRIRRAAVLAAIAVAVVPTLASASANAEHSRLTTSQREFVAAAPFLFAVSGPAPIGRFPACRPGDLRSYARTQSTPDGVIGVVHLRYRRHHRCSLHVRRSPTALLSADGYRIPVPVRGAASTDRGETIRPDLALHYGNAIWGFAWRGSWCGPAARFVRMRLRSGARVKVPLTGPTPPCDGASRSVLLRGLVGGVGSAVQTAPPEWLGLAATINPPGTTDGQFLIGAALTLTNTTDHMIPLDPCPAYSITVSADLNEGPVQAGTGGLLMDCTGSQTIRAGRSLRLRLHKTQYAFGHNHAASGSSLTVTVVIAGVPKATAQVPVA